MNMENNQNNQVQIDVKFAYEVAMEELMQKEVHSFFLLFYQTLSNSQEKKIKFLHNFI